MKFHPDTYNIIPKPREPIPFPKPRPRRPAWLIPDKLKQPKKTLFFITGTLTIKRDVMISLLEGEDSVELNLRPNRVVPTLRKGIDYILVGDLPGAGWSKGIGR